MLGDQSRALRIMSLKKGWDPTKIQGTGEDISNFDKEPDGVDHKTVGTLPQGTPDSFPEDHPGITPGGAIPFNAPDTSGNFDSTSRASRGADPYAGMGGQ
jgi:hypothetical protein